MSAIAAPSTVLLDTHVVLWAASDPARLSEAAREMIRDTGHRVVVSAVSIAEMAIKTGLGKLSLPVSPMELCRRLGFDLLDLHAAAAERLLTLPALHRDPFDRLLIAQALAGDLQLVSGDDRVLAYPDVRLLRA